MSEIKSAYESVMVISLKLGDDGIQSVIEKFKGIISRHAELESVDEWGKRRLAYQILFNFSCTAEFPAELDRRYKIADGVLRTLIVKKADK